MKTFKEYKESKDLARINERLFTKVGRDSIPVFINPTISDLETLINSGCKQVRGLTKEQYVFIWDSYKAGHSQMSEYLGGFDQDLKGLPDICFYLNPKREGYGLEKTGKTTYELLYSSWTGKSISVANSATHLQKLLQFPVMQKLIPYISNADEVLNPHPDEIAANRNSNYYDDPHYHEPKLFDPTQFSHKDAIWQQKDVKPINPYRWGSGLHRVGD